MKRLSLFLAASASVSASALLFPPQRPVIDVRKLLGQKRSVAEKVLGKPFKIEGFEAPIPGVHHYKVPKLGEVLAAPSTVAPFEDGWVEFQFPRAKVKDAVTAMKLIGLDLSKAKIDKDRWVFAELKGWSADWDGKADLGKRDPSVIALTFVKNVAF